MSYSLHDTLVMVYAIFAVLSFIQWLLYLVFILHYEIKKRDRKFEWTKLFTPFNIPLVIGSPCLVGAYAVNAVNLTSDLTLPWNFLFFLQQVFMATMISSYVFYSWKRSGKLVRSIYAPSVYKFMYYMVLVSPAVFYIPIIPAFWRMVAPDPTPREALSNDFWFISVIVSGFTCCILDFVFVIAFVKNVVQSFLHREDVEPEFWIVSVHGILANFFCFLSLGMYVWAGSVLTIEEKMILDTAAEGIWIIISTVLFSMKIILYRQKVYDETHHDPISELMRSKCVKEDLGITDQPPCPPPHPSRRESDRQVKSLIAESLKNFHPLRETNSTRFIPASITAVSGGNNLRDSYKRDSTTKRDSSSSKSSKSGKEVPLNNSGVPAVPLSTNRESIHTTRESLKRVGLPGDRDSLHGFDNKSLRSFNAQSLRSVHTSHKSTSVHSPRDSLKKERTDMPEVPKIVKDRVGGSGNVEVSRKLSTKSGSNVAGDLVVSIISRVPSALRFSENVTGDENPGGLEMDSCVISALASRTNSSAGTGDFSIGQ
ncbi:hypothetical protein BCR33DRAFT_713984 [Rhizoclosmatium globosum]|uniref:Uncharacterized protein n=1 Tax=Rhizoclosmatium globosum TaxID=329046 RepID=A0A1Y2CP96_9FUNG|nr:hypothetical protein BCR33DRAFT_713984 [Rhizoclosmatium globosum]|eukprot:ORY48869.1 hypothetical protein BCR33DRAFT_713984 [Rhizoclosmatium globosum]